MAYKVSKVFFKTVENLENYNTTLGIIDIPEFAKLPEDKITTKADQYVTRLINENRIDDVYCQLFGI